jgi:glycosyltransferase involved in cell wall biosynthesis
MKTILTIHHFLPNYSTGAEVYAFRLAGWLLKHGHEVEVVCVESIAHDSKTELEYKHETYEGISVWRLYFNLARAANPFRQSFDNPAIGAWFAEFLNRERPDLVHMNSCYLLSVSTISATKQLQLPLIVTLHDFWFVCPRITLLKPTGQLCTVPEDVAECAWCLATEKRRFRWSENVSRGAAGNVMQRVLALPYGAKLSQIKPDASEIAYRRQLLMEMLKKVDLLLAPSEFLRGVFIKQGIDPAKIIYSRYGLDTSHWINPSNTNRRSSTELQITYIGQLSPHKGVHLLVKALKCLDFSNRPAQLKIYGDPAPYPKYVKSLQKLAQGNPAIEFTGRFDNHRVAEILAEADVVVVPSIWYENSPIAIMEALTTGTPVVTANLGGMPELVQHEVNGLLFKAGDEGDLAKQLQRLLDEPNLLGTLTSKARPVRLIDDEMRQVLSIYENLLH